MAKKKKKLTGAGVTQADKRVRIETVADMLLASKSTRTIVKFIMSEYSVAIQTAYHYIQDADKIIAKTLQGEREQKVKRAIGQREDLIEKLISEGSLAMAAQVIADKNKLEALYETEDIQAAVNIKVQQQ